MTRIRDLSDAPLADLLALSGRVAVVTGGASGIGRACCARLVEAGATVVVADIDEEAARETAAALGPERSRRTSTCARRRRCARSSSGRSPRQGRLDIWVNAAGVYPTSPLLELSDEDWDVVLDTNLRGTFLGAQGGGARDDRAGTRAA